METEFPNFTPGMTQVERLPYLRTNCKLKIHLKELLHAKLSTEVPTIIFGPSVQGYHIPLFREGHQRRHTLLELGNLATTDSVIIGVKEKNSRLMARFEVSPAAFSSLLEGFEKRVQELANAGSLWSQRPSAAVQASRPVIPTDREFLSQYVLIGNLDPNLFASQTAWEALPDMIRTIVSHDMPSCQVDEDALRLAFENTPSHIRPPNLGLEESKGVRSTKVIKLREQVRVGLTLGGGTSLLKRAQANDPASEFGIFLTRQFLTDKEAELLMLAETSQIDITLLMARRIKKKRSWTILFVDPSKRLWNPF